MDEFDAATDALLSVACPGCGCEPEVVTWWRDKVTKVRRGYTCTCGFRVIDGIVQGMNIG